MKKISLILSLCITLSCSKQIKVDMKILNYTGRVTVNTVIVKDTQTALKTGDLIETMDNSICDIIINEKNIIRLNPGSKLKLNISESTLILEKGWLGAVTRKIFTDTGKFIVKTPTVTAAIRGTSFCIKVENEKSTYFCTCNGSIELKGEASSINETVTAAHHAARRFILDKSGAIIEDNNPGLLYHADNSVEVLAGIINEKIDWNIPDIH